jgi:hypothetical protein
MSGLADLRMSLIVSKPNQSSTIPTSSGASLHLTTKPMKRQIALGAYPLKCDAESEFYREGYSLRPKRRETLLDVTWQHI